MTDSVLSTEAPPLSAQEQEEGAGGWKRDGRRWKDGGMKEADEGVQ